MLSKIPVLGRLFRGGAAASGPVHVLRLHGVISPTRSNGPLGGSGPVLNLESLAADIEKAFKPKDVAAVALLINSPGGSPVQSNLIAARIRQLADEKQVPVLAFTEDVAASGGYWLA
ncbi:MAG: S49 family peptidase, partial [Pseudomonadota bacterium]|nr:S49 family peptidase [Pseudomonadota bacterium]